jgi:aminopeptidase N
VTVFATSDWLICLDAPSERAALELTIVVPRALRVVGNGQLVSERDQPDGRRAVTWRQNRPMPSYIYGFAAGRFSEASNSSGSLQLRYFGEGFSAAELTDVFRETERTLRFFEQRSGVKYADASYS